MNNTELANPAPLGLAAFGMTTILLNLHNAGYWNDSATSPRLKPKKRIMLPSETRL